MGNILYVIAIILLIAWAIGYFGYATGGIIHVLLIVALIALIIQIVQGRRI